MVNTTLIIEVIAIVFLLGILVYIAFVMFGPNKPDGPPNGNKKCWPGTQWDEAYGGCVSAPLTPVSKSECENGVWKPSSTDGTKGICVCEKSYSGSKCDTVCAANSECGNGRCVGGTCVCDEGYFGTRCDTKLKCKTCPTGWKTSGNTNKCCDECADGWGPPGTCDKKEYKDLLLPTPAREGCHASTNDDSFWNSQCKQYYGDDASYVGTNGSDLCYGDNGCRTYETATCKVPKAYALPSFDAYASQPACMKGNEKYAMYKLYEGQPNSLA